MFNQARQNFPAEKKGYDLRLARASVISSSRLLISLVSPPLGNRTFDAIPLPL